MKQHAWLSLLVVMLSACDKSPQPGRVVQQPPGTTKSSGAPSAGTGQQAEHKNIITLTPNAAARVRTLLNERSGKYLRVGLTDDNDYQLELDDHADPLTDYVGESLDVPIVVDRKSAMLFAPGTTVDFLNEGDRVGFTFSSSDLAQDPPDTSVSLVAARQGFKTTLARQESGGPPADEPPAGVFRLVRYSAPLGQMVAYLTPDPQDGNKHPAIIWITGGDCNSIDNGLWQEAPPTNDQTASAFRKAGIVMMFPSLRGGNDNPGIKEGFLGEVDDVLAAADFLGQQAFVDPDRIYLGGHSTGGTLVLLVAECSDRFRAVFSFGPVDDVSGYGPRFNPFDLSNRKESQLRSPGRWLHSIHSPVFVIEGTGGNLRALQAMSRASQNPQVRFLEVAGTDHFGVLAPTNGLIAQKILQDTEPDCNLKFTPQELSALFTK